MTQWLIPPKGRNSSCSQELNFLWRNRNVYFMDNHLAAAWCWFQHLQAGCQARLIHVDQHYDTAPVNFDVANQQGALLRGDLDGYLSALDPDHRHGDIRLFRWDNYIPIAAASIPGAFESFHFFTSGVGNRPNRLGAPIRRRGVRRVPTTVARLPRDVPLIVNIDLDYVFLEDEDDAGPSHRLVSDGSVRALARWSRSAIESGQAIVTTVALSPECCDGWDVAVRLSEVFAEALGQPFKLQ
jgi:hypothetical protein